MEAAITWLVAEGHGYPFIFMLLLGAGLGAPFPEDVPLLAAGVMSAHGGLSVPEATLACAGFVLTRDLIVFGLGYRYGTTLLQKKPFNRLAGPEDVERYQALILQNAARIVFIGRFAIGLRSAIFFAAGTARVRPALFIAMDGLAGAVSIPVFVWLGWKFATELPRLQQLLSDIRWVTLAVLLVVGGFFLFRYLARRFRQEVEGTSPTRPELESTPTIEDEAL